MPLKPAALFLWIWICVSCAAGPAQQRPPEHIRNSIYYLNQGAKLFAKGCYARAMDYFQDAHQLYTAADDQAGVILALNSIADTYFRLGDMESALRVYDDAIITFPQTETHHPNLLWALSNKAAALIELNRLEEAASVLDRSSDMDGKSGAEALYLKTRALWLIQEQRFEPAQALLEEALTASGADRASIRSSIYYAMGHLLMRSDRPEQARTRFEQALILDRKENIAHDTARDLEAVGTTYAAVADHQNAVHYFKRSAKIYALLKDSRRTKTVVAHLEESARLADIDIQTTLHWIQNWLMDKSGNAICD